VTGDGGARVEGGAPGVGVAAPASFLYSERVAARSLYFAAVRNGDESNFFNALV